jgi:hypothetical protein
VSGRTFDATTTVPAATGGHGRWWSRVEVRNLGLVLVLVILVVVGASTSDNFFTTDNLRNILVSSSVIGVVTVGAPFVIIGGGIDLSVGALVALASVWATTVATQSYGPAVMIVCAVTVGAGAGLVNGWLVAYGRLAPFIVTLAMLRDRRRDADGPHDDRLQHLRRALRTRCLRRRHHRRHAQVDVVGHGQALDQVELLVDGRDPQLQCRRGIRQRDRLTAPADLTGVRLVSPGQHFDQCRFAGTVLAEQAVHLTGPDRLVDAVERAHARGLLDDALHLQQRRVHAPSSECAGARRTYHPAVSPISDSTIGRFPVASGRERR